MNKGLQSLPWDPPIFLMICMKIIKHLISNEWRFLQYRIQFDMLRGYPKPCTIFWCNLKVSTLVEKTLSQLERAHGCYQKLLSYSLCILGGLLTTSVAMDVSRGSIAPHFPCWKGAKNLAFFFVQSESLSVESFWTEMTWLEPGGAYMCHQQLLISFLIMHLRKIIELLDRMYTSNCST